MNIDGIKFTYKPVRFDVIVEKDLKEAVAETDVWMSWKAKVLSYDGCKKLADYCGIVVKETPQVFCSPTDSNMQQHIRGMRVGYKGDADRDNRIFCEWEASQLNTGQLVKKAEWGMRHDQRSKIDSQYKSNMAFKRAYCRGVLRLVGLIGVYSSVEAPAFETWGNPVDYTSL